MNTGLWVLLAGLGWAVVMAVVMALFYAHGEREAEYIEVEVAE